ncbi:formimidoylglutamate deiminase [Amycolatopsis pithecellobii]|uniref:Formimidoylglutamate deiminase n=1 Tax=Amycolatopsis pithecellobii TaxID=664692 RepID=A0A6N7YZ68_9PSEU|nr:formimidoylglutamate deiminase [Amycolatopsis pithecellobii]MTD57192.1 formimidoylglutamate deiminase [Amycolatopsis pithecellobii]
MTTYWCARAWLPGGVANGVRIDVEAGRLKALTPGRPRAGAVLNGLVLPGFVNEHSHAFHRALRGRTQQDRGTFWTWREQMYALAGRLDPESYYRLARGVFAELTLAGYTSVAEFHYLHHAPGGRPYADPNAMGYALAEAATDAGIRLTVLDTCYLTGGFGRGLDERQKRFADADAEAWAERVARFKPAGEVRVGAAVHSVRAVPAEQLPVITGRPLHVHLSEQRGENEECLAYYGRTPARVLADAGVFGPGTVAVHGTHLTEADIATLDGTRVCFCPTTERDLGDGIGPARALADAGVALCLGSDSHAVVDPFEEVRALEMGERLAAETRGRFTPAELLAAAGGAGLVAGAPADLVVVDLETVRTAGIEPEGVLFAASAADVTDVLIGGRRVVRDREHQLIERPEMVLAKEIEALWRS